MSAASERALRKAMRERNFERVYYFVGDEDFLKESTAREMIASVVEPGTREFNYQMLRGTEVAPDTLDTALNTPALLASRRLIVIRDVQALKKEPRRVLLEYLQHPAPDVILLLIAAAGEKADALLAAAASTVQFAQLAPDRIPRWISHHAATELGVEIGADACELLHQAAGDELASLAAELDKLASYTAGKPIDAAAVAAVVGIRQGESLSDLIDAVVLRDATAAARLAGPVLTGARTTAVSVIMALTTHLLAVAWGRAARDRGLPSAAIEREYYGLLRERRVYAGRAWGAAVASWMRSHAIWTTPELDRALRLLLLADASAKEARVSSEEQLISTLVLSLCTTDVRNAA
jgi:DNA polymerase-3 subunit delta